MAIINIIYKKNNAIYKESTSKTLEAWLSENPNTPYHVVTDASFDNYFECLAFIDGVLTYDIPLLKLEANKVRKAEALKRFAPYDKVFFDINALEIPESEFNAEYAELKSTAEAQRVLIREQSETQKTTINNATTAQEIFDIIEDIKNV